MFHIEIEKIICVGFHLNELFISLTSRCQWDVDTGKVDSDIFMWLIIHAVCIVFILNLCVLYSIELTLTLSHNGKNKHRKYTKFWYARKLKVFQFHTT